MGDNSSKLVDHSIDLAQFPVKNARLLPPQPCSLNNRIQIREGVTKGAYTIWQQHLEDIKLNHQHLLLPIEKSYQSSGFCSDTGLALIHYDNYPYTLFQELKDRKAKKKTFDEGQLWYTLYAVSSAQTQMKNIGFGMIGDLRPSNILLNQRGFIKCWTRLSTPTEKRNLEKAVSQPSQKLYLAPQQLETLREERPKKIEHQSAEMFSLGIILLSLANLTDYADLYDMKSYRFNRPKLGGILQQWANNTNYSEILRRTVSSMCHFDYKSRISAQELWQWIQNYESKIKGQCKLHFENVPQKIAQLANTALQIMIVGSPKSKEKNPSLQIMQTQVVSQEKPLLQPNARSNPNQTQVQMFASPSRKVGQSGLQQNVLIGTTQSIYVNPRNYPHLSNLNSNRPIAPLIKPDERPEIPKRSIGFSTGYSNYGGNRA